jgi:signal transduction histidine kinase
MESAELSSRAKSDFVAMMSHEVRNPLNIVFGMAELLRMSRLTAEQRRYVDSIQRTSKGLVSLLGDAMAMSRLQVGRSQVQRVPESIHE